MELNFEVSPKKAKADKELFSGKAVLTICKPPEEKNKTYRFELNKNAAEELKLEENDKVGFALNNNGELFLVNVKDKPIENSLNVTKSLTMSSKKVHNFVSSVLALDFNKDNYVELSYKEEYISMHVCSCSLMTVPEMTVPEDLKHKEDEEKEDEKIESEETYEYPLTPEESVITSSVKFESDEEEDESDEGDLLV